MYDQFALLSLRLTFGGSSCPNEFCLFSEMCTDLANDILHCKDWDPSKLCSPHSEKIPDPILQPDELEFTPAKSLDVSIPLDTWGRVDDFIDDGIVIVPDLLNRARALQALLLAIHVVCQPLAPNEPIPRDDCLSLGKLAEEGVLHKAAYHFFTHQKVYKLEQRSKENNKREKGLIQTLGVNCWPFKSCCRSMSHYEIFSKPHPTSPYKLGRFKWKQKRGTLLAQTSH
jgi:hypothetical protein